MVVWGGTFSTAWSQEPQPTEFLIQAETAHQRIPVLSIQYPAMDVDMAYSIQKAYIEKKLTTETLAGFKAGLTSGRGQRQFGLSAPVAGVLFGSGKLTGQVSVDSTRFHRLMIETEIGFVIGTPLRHPVPDIAALQQAIKEVVPLIELPDLGFADMANLKGVDIIAANVSARQFIVGRSRAVDDINLNMITVSLSLDGQEINRGKGSDAFGDQWQAALWLVNMVIGQGWTLETGQLLVTGALGKMRPGMSGSYVADYDDLGKIAFEID